MSDKSPSAIRATLVAPKPATEELLAVSEISAKIPHLCDVQSQCLCRPMLRLQWAPGVVRKHRRQQADRASFALRKE